MEVCPVEARIFGDLNETIIPWSLLIAIYPYLTGLVAGAFTVSSGDLTHWLAKDRESEIRELVDVAAHTRPR